jgi:cellulase/cellobiase CelA1
MDFVVLKYLHDSKKRLIENLDGDVSTSSSTDGASSSANDAPSSVSVAGIIAATPPGTGAAAARTGAGSIVSCVLLFIIGVVAAYLSWNYTKEHNIDTGMAVIYTLAAFNCGSCFLCFYLCFANKSHE